MDDSTKPNTPEDQTQYLQPQPAKPIDDDLRRGASETEFTQPTARREDFGDRISNLRSKTRHSGPEHAVTRIRLRRLLRLKYRSSLTIHSRLTRRHIWPHVLLRHAARKTGI
jgi:hypothetical protein